MLSGIDCSPVAYFLGAAMVRAILRAVSRVRGGGMGVSES